MKTDHKSRSKIVSSQHNFTSLELESVTQCPACSGTKCHPLHCDLQDWTFNAVSGNWSLTQCEHCGAAYLDPRPTVASIGRAYVSYYTHTQSFGSIEYTSLSMLRRFRRRLVNGYAVWRFRLNVNEPSSVLGLVAAFLLPAYRKQIDHRFRNLPKRSDKEHLLLDVGCGDGGFLALSASCGWNVLGIDSDAEAIKQVKKRGLNALYGTLELFDGRQNVFDCITMNHVIEHLHDPEAALRICLRLLKPGGRIWLETPNIDSYSHLRFGRFWRGLEAPRHLVIFSDKSLRQILTKVGFVAVEAVSRPSSIYSMYASSKAIQSRVEQTTSKLPVAMRVGAFISKLSAVVRSKHREQLTFIARKHDRHYLKSGA